ncbi:copper-binding protein [Sphingomonas koreensis]|uniref:copper-binding protein n=1 Tax=Sphingomonas koreensis TaxID=93064 RepID=UPI00234E8768|nr:copper-binding protein [Sphingomonas koreensis]MDC7810181.1 copper-binding protein [Sphingomonas koreensis]
MMMARYWTPVLALAALLGACGEKAATDNPAGAVDNSAGATSATDAAAKAARGSGTITAIDLGAGSVTLDHGPIPEVNWPAMTMAFAADPGLLAGLKPGDKVSFELAVRDGGATVTAIRKQ